MQRASDVTARGKNDAAANTTQTMSDEHLIGELEKVIEKKKKRKNQRKTCCLRTILSFPCQKDSQEQTFWTKTRDKKRARWWNEIYLNRLNDEIDTGGIPREIEFYFGGQNYKFFLACSKLNLSKDNENFIDFLSSEVGSQILKGNMLSILIETRNMFYENFNTNESIYDFLLR